MMKKHIFILPLLLLLLSVYPASPICAQGNTRTETYNGRTIKERFHPRYKFYYYSIGDISEKAGRIEQTKTEFEIATKKPLWAAKEKVYGIFDDIKIHTLQCLARNDNSNYPHQFIMEFDVLINDNGDVYCTNIVSKKCLFDVYSNEELLWVFDEIGKFKFPTPVVTEPEKGYQKVTLYF